jgi:hypothetical protein
MKKVIYFVLFYLILINNSIAGTRDKQVEDNKHTEYGQQFIHTGELTGLFDQGKMFHASAVAIDDYHILTAAHVVKNCDMCIFKLKNKEYCITNIIYHKNFDDDSFGVADIAIGYSEKSFDLPFYPELYTENNEIGLCCSIVGFGFTGTFDTGAKTMDGKKRAGSNYIEDIYSDLLICSASRIGQKNRTSLEFLIASGDSGGPLYIGGKLAGINSCVLSTDKNSDSSYGDESGHTRISKFIDWINDNRTKKDN